jgi:CheY-like chemotaxis protein
MRKNVLLIDDDPDEIELFRNVLEDIDPTISYYYCLSGKTALSGLTSGKIDPDIIFLDINMPEMDGWECLRNMKAMRACQDIPVYMYSTSKRENDRAIAYKTGAVDLITKANSYGKFKETIAAILAIKPVRSFTRAGMPFFVIRLVRYWYIRRLNDPVREMVATLAWLFSCYPKHKLWKHLHRKKLQAC